MNVSLASLLRGRQIAAWNAIMPKRIAAIEYGAGHVRVLHPTKGWRRVPDRRLGL